MAGLPASGQITLHQVAVENQGAGTYTDVSLKTLHDAVDADKWATPGTTYDVAEPAALSEFHGAAKK